MTGKSTAGARARRRAALGIALTWGLLSVTACGSSSHSASATAAGESPVVGTQAAGTKTLVQTTPTGASAAARTLTLAADPSGKLRYDKSTLAGKSGAVVIAFTNMSGVAHNVTVASASGSTVGATPTFSGGTRSLSLTLSPGTYTFYCSVPGHRGAGMQGTLVIRQ